MTRSHDGPTLTPATHSNKACAVGAISFYVDKFVTRRISKFTYGAPYFPSQGTKVLRDREIRFNLCYVTKGAPQQRASLSVVKYTGAQTAPQWMDTEPGSVFGFNNFVGGTQIEQTNSRRCVQYRQTSPLLRVFTQHGRKNARRRTRGILM